MKKNLLLILPILFLSGCSLTGNNHIQNTGNIEKISQVEQQSGSIDQLSGLQQENNFPQEEQKIPQSKKLNHHCGLTINYPTTNSTVSFPVTISGIIDNNNTSTLGCSWTMNEGQAGTAQLYFWDQGNNNRHQINTPFIVPVSDWMTLGPVSFSVTINFNNSGIGLPSGTPMQIVFTEENPSGATPDTLTLPIVLQ